MNITFIILNFLFFKILCVLKIPFKRRFLDKLTSENIMEQLRTNYLTKKKKIGEPYQEIPFTLKMSQSPVFIIGKNYSENIIKFNENKSNTYKSTNYFHHFALSDLISGNLSYDTFDFGNNITIKNFNFVLAKELSNEAKKLSAEIGLLFRKYPFENFEPNFIEQLQNKKIINSSVFGFKYNTDDEGEFIIGDLIHEYDKSFKKEDFTFVKLNIPEKILVWDIKFDKVTLNQIVINDFFKRITFEIEYGFILGIPEFYNIIKKEFFDKHKNECKEQNITHEKYFVCNNNINLKKFPILQFNVRELKYNITFDKNDLFYEFGNKKYFLIVFRTDFWNSKWTFGKPYFKKYLSFYDKERKIYGIYPNKSSSFNIWNIIALFLIIQVCLLIIYITFKHCISLHNKRRIKANIIENDYVNVTQTITNPLVKEN